MSIVRLPTMMRAGATRYALPVARQGLHRYTMLAGLLLVFTAAVSLVAPTDPDVWWHLRNGKLILESGIPSQDLYSYTAQGREWLVQEWLTELAMYKVQSVFGYGALSLAFGLLQMLGGLLAYLIARRVGAGRILSLLLLMLYTIFAAPTWGVRPQVLTPLFLGIFYLILLAYRDNPRRVRLLALLPPLTALWANLHASYFIGIALLGAFLVGEFANNLLCTREQPTPLKPLFFALVGSLLATLLNPYFAGLWTYPLTYLLNGTSNPLLRYTQEWQSPNFHEPGSLLFAVTLLAGCLTGLARSNASGKATWRVAAPKIDVTLAIVLCAFTLMALQAVRLMPLYGLVVLPLLGGGVAALLPRLSGNEEAPAPPLEGRINWGIAGVVAVGIYLFVTWLPQAQTQPEPRTDTAFRYPVGAANYIAQISGPVRMYNSFAWGGYLIYKLYPQQKVFIDGRADMYRVGIFEDSINIEGAGPGWRETLAKYGVDSVIIVRNGPLDYALAHEPGWSAAYKDDLAVVYRHTK